MAEIRRSIGREALQMLIDDINALEALHWRVREQCIEYGVIDEGDMTYFSPIYPSTPIRRLSERIAERMIEEQERKRAK